MYEPNLVVSVRTGTVRSQSLLALTSLVVYWSVPLILCSLLYLALQYPPTLALGMAHGMSVKVSTVTLEAFT